jgi:uncharacterized membrane protein
LRGDSLAVESRRPRCRRQKRYLTRGCERTRYAPVCVPEAASGLASRWDSEPLHCLVLPALIPTLTLETACGETGVLSGRSCVEPCAEMPTTEHEPELMQADRSQQSSNQELQKMEGSPAMGDSSLSISLEKQIEKALGETVPQKLLPEVKSRIIQAVISETYYQGPLPPPEMMGQWEDILPGAADRIMRMAEKEQDTRLYWNRTTITAESRNSTLGLVFGIVALALLIGGALGCLYLGYEVAAGGFITATALGLVPAFIKGRGLFNWFDDNATKSQDAGESKASIPQKKASNSAPRRSRRRG